MYEKKLSLTNSKRSVGDDDLQKKLYNAIKSDDETKLKEALDEGADVQKLYSGMTALHYAVDCNSDKAASVLIKQGAYVDALDMNENTPLHYAMENSNEKMTRLLLESGADIKEHSVHKTLGNSNLKWLVDEYTPAENEHCELSRRL